ncbi:5-formyltetrahydrofolate cyclo-ligase [Oceanisphaera sp. W20_SRM_FM3]|uniref:5-formyltetrahydrofolate cyclo-ligase n=1 Tax=Oceanisphaera sp. W20_SRM_FM3 TaxID=3240267 RepID=UPI003F9E58B3
MREAQLSRQQLRQQVRLTRRQLTSTEQTQAAVQLVSQVANIPQLAQAKAVALYLANDGELDPWPLINWYWSQGCHVYLPVLHPFCQGHLLFLRYQPDTLMHTNALGILEPKLDIRLLAPKNALDIIYTPLVAFDVQGNRLGMGGGFYDRTLCQNADTHSGQHSSQHSSPRAVGLAHDCQQVAALPIASWDVPLVGVVTPTQYFFW